MTKHERDEINQSLAKCMLNHFERRQGHDGYFNFYTAAEKAVVMEALDKMVGMQVAEDIVGDVCPNCEVVLRKKTKYCSCCGQRLLWEG